MSLRAEQIIAILERHQVRYLIIGGLAAVLHGSPIVTADADICPAQDGENLRRLAQALKDLRARLRVEREPEGVAFPFDSAFLANVQVLNLMTPYGDLDLSYVPSGTAGYDDLVRNASNLIIGGCPVQVASLGQRGPVLLPVRCFLGANHVVPGEAPRNRLNARLNAAYG